MDNFDMYNMDFSEGLSSIWTLLGDAFFGNFRQGLSVFIAIIVISMIMGLASAAFEGSGSDTAQRVPALVGILAIAGVCLSSMNALFGLVTNTLSQIDIFSKALLPTLSAAMIAAGTPTSAIIKSSAIVLFSDILITIITRFLLPCTYAYLALVTANAAINNDTLNGLANFVKNCVSWALKLLLTLFIAYITISGTISGTSDVMIEKSAKLAMTGAVPVVGNIIAEATQTVIAGAGILRSSIGVFGLIAVLSITVSPIIVTGMNFMALKLAAAVSAPASPPDTVKYIERLADVFSLMLAMTAASALVLLIGIVSCMQTWRF
jgi:stage III sporulation protein AE